MKPTLTGIKVVYALLWTVSLCIQGPAQTAVTSKTRWRSSHEVDSRRFIIPLKIRPVRVTSEFGRRRGRMHNGIDFAAAHGDRVIAAADGRVIFVGTKRGYGKIVMVSHGRYQTRYAHLSRILVRKGTDVKQGQTLGKVGRTGNATGSHLHFEIRVDGVPKDPRGFLWRKSPRWKRTKS